MHRALQPTERPNRLPSTPWEANNRPTGVGPGMTGDGRLMRARHDGPLLATGDSAVGGGWGPAATGDLPSHLRPGEVAAAVETAHRLGTRVAVHINTAV